MSFSGSLETSLRSTNRGSTSSPTVYFVLGQTLNQVQGDGGSAGLPTVVRRAAGDWAFTDAESSSA